MAKTAANRPSITRLPVTDQRDGLGKQRQAFADERRELDIALACHRADHDAATILADPGQLGNAIDVDQVIGEQQSAC